MSLYDDDALVGTLTREAIAKSGSRIFQIHKLAPTDEAHVEALLVYFAPPWSAQVVDLGCGVGGVAELMQYQRPDLTFTLLNVSRSQLDLCPKWMKRIEGRMEEAPLGTASFDAAMICYALGHVALDATLLQAWRVLRPGSPLLVYDLCAEDPTALGETLGYRPPSVVTLDNAARAAGFHLDVCWRGWTTTADFDRLDPSDAERAAVAAAEPVLMVFERC